MAEQDTPPQAPAQDTSAEPSHDQPWWIFIERQYSADVVVGPYPNHAAADYAMIHALIIDGLCEEDCLDAYLVVPPFADGVEQIFIDPANPHHAGE